MTRSILHLLIIGQALHDIMFNSKSKPIRIEEEISRAPLESQNICKLQNFIFINDNKLNSLSHSTT